LLLLPPPYPCSHLLFILDLVNLIKIFLRWHLILAEYLIEPKKQREEIEQADYEQEDIQDLRDIVGRLIQWHYPQKECL